MFVATPFKHVSCMHAFLHAIPACACRLCSPQHAFWLEHAAHMAHELVHFVSCVNFKPPQTAGVHDWGGGARGGGGGGVCPAQTMTGCVEALHLSLRRGAGGRGGSLLIKSQTGPEAGVALY